MNHTNPIDHDHAVQISHNNHRDLVDNENVSGISIVLEAVLISNGLFADESITDGLADESGVASLGAVAHLDDVIVLTGNVRYIEDVSNILVHEISFDHTKTCVCNDKHVTKTFVVSASSR